MKTKICSKCGQEKNLNEFYKDITNIDGHKYKCKTCSKIVDKKYKINSFEKRKQYKKLHREEILKKGKEYYQKNKEKIMSKCREYYRLNKSKKLNYFRKNRKRIRIYENIKYINNINYKLAKRLRNRIRQSLKRNSKYSDSLKLLGCSIDFLKHHLEHQFKPNMSWNNWGTGCNGKGMQEWHIDHIKPCASFDLSKPEEQRKCFHYSNLQPLWAMENCSKQDNIIQ